MIGRGLERFREGELASKNERSVAVRSVVSWTVRRVVLGDKMGEGKVSVMEAQVFAGLEQMVVGDGQA